jgi:hypothetical protein
MGTSWRTLCVELSRLTVRRSASESLKSSALARIRAEEGNFHCGSADVSKFDLCEPIYYIKSGTYRVAKLHLKVTLVDLSAACRRATLGEHEKIGVQ